MAELPPHLRDIPLFVRAELALREASRQAILDHRRSNVPLVYWRDGKVVLVPPYGVPLPDIDPLTAQFHEAAGRKLEGRYTAGPREESELNPLLMRPTGLTL
jgi:hypothetical protein